MRRPLLCGCICLFVCITLWMQINNPPPLDGSDTAREGEWVSLTGQVYQKEYRVYYGEEVLVLYLNSILYSEEAAASSAKIKQINPTNNLICELKLNELPEGSLVPKLGMKVQIQGSWRDFAHATNPGEFDAADYYTILGISAKIEDARLSAIGKQYWPVRETLYQIKQHFLGNLYRAFPQKEASILAKMLLGDGSGLDEEIRELYQSNGIVHILSISGLHITMLGMGLYKALRKLGCPIRLAAIVGGGVIILYGLMTGFGISACRAIGMYLIHMLGELLGKTYDMLTAMGVLAVLMLIDNPLLIYHSGFLLSFTSVCGVGLLAPLLQFPSEWFRRRPGERQYITVCRKQLQKFMGNLGVSTAVTLFTLPVQFFFFYKVPVYSVFINLLVIPFVSIVMLIGILVMIFPWLSILVSVEIWIFAWFEWLCEMFRKLPGHTWVRGCPEFWRILIYYGGIVVLLLLGKRLKKHIQLVGLTMLVFLISVRMPQPLQITMLDVGQGDCICVQTADGCFLFDGGSSSRSNVGEKVILPFLQYEGIDHIDGIFLSHGDTDHYSGILQLLQQEQITIGTIYLPQVGTESMKDFQVLADYMRKVKYMSKGDGLSRDNILITCLHPTKGYEADSNAYSACYLLKIEEFSMLFTGDVEGEGEALLIQELQKRQLRQVDVLKVAHHGSKYSTTEEFLQISSPTLSLISCGKNNSYGHPHKETLERLKQTGSTVMVTTEYGAIIIELKEKGKVYGFRK